MKNVGNVTRLQPLLSRIPTVFHNPSNEEIEALMRKIASQGWQGLTPTECVEVCNYLLDRIRINGCDPDLRLLTHKAPCLRSVDAGTDRTALARPGGNRRYGDVTKGDPPFAEGKAPTESEEAADGG